MDQQPQDIKYKIILSKNTWDEVAIPYFNSLNGIEAPVGANGNPDFGNPGVCLQKSIRKLPNVNRSTGSTFSTLSSGPYDMYRCLLNIKKPIWFAEQDLYGVGE
jgi:hypothetical protein